MNGSDKTKGDTSMIYFVVRLARRLFRRGTPTVQAPLDIPTSNVDYLH